MEEQRIVPNKVKLHKLIILGTYFYSICFFVSLVHVNKWARIKALFFFRCITIGCTKRFAYEVTHRLKCLA